MNLAELKILTQKPGGWCISIYIPLSQPGEDINLGPIRIKNMLGEAEKYLSAIGLKSPEVSALLEPIQQLLLERPVWQTQSGGLAIYRSEKVFNYHYFPLNFEELMVVGTRFHVKPILSLFREEKQFYVLALSQNEVKLFQNTRHSFSEVKLQNIPNSLTEALKYDTPEKQLQFHTGASSEKSKRGVIFHGHGGVGIDDNRDRILLYFRQIDIGLREILKEEHSPLVLACVNHLVPIYKEANKYPYLLSEGIDGNPEETSPEELHERSWAIVKPYFQKKQEETATQYKQLAGTSLTSNNIVEIVPAAHQGRIDSLFVSVNLHQWGTFDPDTNAVGLSEKSDSSNEDLLDLAAVETFLRGGTVYVVDKKDIPDEAPIAAIFRY